jgi:hypothetical protein
MTDDQAYEDYQNTLAEIVDGGGCMETMEGVQSMREGTPSKRDLLSSDALTTGIADSVDDVLAEVDTEDVRTTLRAEYDTLDDVRTALRDTVDTPLFDALAQLGLTLGSLDAFALEPAVCLKTFSEADLDDALTLVPHIHEAGVVGRIVTRTTVHDRTVTVHAIPEWNQSYAVVTAEGTETLVLFDGTTVDCADATEQQTGVDCDPERAARTEYVQRMLSYEGTDYVVETTCSPV